MRPKTAKKICCREEILLPRRLKSKYIRDIAICEQNMATNSVKESTSKADRSWVNLSLPCFINFRRFRQGRSALATILFVVKKMLHRVTWTRQYRVNFWSAFASQTHAFWNDICVFMVKCEPDSWRRFCCFAPKYFFMAQHTSASKSITFLLRWTDSRTGPCWPAGLLLSRTWAWSSASAARHRRTLPTPPKIYATGPILDLGWT